MPELPEVETIRRSLAQSIALDQKGRAHVRKVTFLRAHLREAIPVDMAAQVLDHQPILAVRRRGKYLLIETPKGAAIIHLGMSGRMLISQPEDPLPKHTHARFLLGVQGRELEWRFIDPRRFGRFGAVLGSNWQQHPYLKALGPEPLDMARLGKHLHQHASRRPIKTLLLDHRIVAGIGNIYACEALFHAGVHPEALALHLDQAAFDRIAKAIKQVLKQAITQQGTSFRDYRTALDEPGSYAQLLAVYGQKACRRCQEAISQILQAGRRTWYCPLCQPKKD